jgi:pimeloyl-ACP methyl ester carboxylesterase
LLCEHPVNGISQHAFEDYILASKKKSLKQFAKAPDFKKTFVARFGRSGMHGPLNWYKAHHANYNWDDEKEIPTEHLRVDIPVLFIGCTRDPVCLTQAIYIPQQAGLLPDLTVEEVESGHWQTFEAPDLCGPIIAAWLQQKSADLTTEPKT